MTDAQKREMVEAIDASGEALQLEREGRDLDAAQAFADVAGMNERAARRILAEGTLSGVRGAATLFARAERDLRVAADYCRIAGSPRALAFVRARRRLYRAERRAIERACGERRRAYGAI